MAENVGRPKADIDWEEVNRLLVSGCSGAEIAGSMGLNKATIYERCVRDHGITFTEYSNQFYSKGDSLLRDVQFNKAISGDNMMLVWLGKNRLKQRDKEEENKSTEPLKVYVNGKLATGINLSTTSISDSDNNGSEQGS